MIALNDEGVKLFHKLLIISCKLTNMMLVEGLIKTP